MAFHDRRCFRLIVVLILANLCRTTGAEDGTSQPPTSRQWAILIGVEKYHRANRLKYTVSDAQELAQVLSQRGGLERARILEMTDARKNPRFQPLRASLIAELPKSLEQVGENDRLIVYFSGHGFRDNEGKLYLAPLDCDPDNPATTGISIEWFKQRLADCKAKQKLLIIDACHAGTEKGEDNGTGVTSRDLTSPFDGLNDIVTLASSKAEEKSQLWDDKQHSLFTYWLIQALKGHADSDGDSRIDVDELNKYVHRNVTRTAELRFPRPQTPVRIIRGGTAGVPLVIHLHPQRLKTVLSDMAEQLGLAIEEEQAISVGLLEFTNDAPLGEFLRSGYGLLGRYAAEELERTLIELGRGKYSVVDRRRLQRALSAEGFTVDDLASRTAVADLSKRTGGLPIVGIGTLSNRRGRVVTLRCKLVSTKDDRVIGAVGGTAQINESEWAMLGFSASTRPSDRRPPLPGLGVPQFSVEDRVIQRLDERAKAPHPLLDPNFPFPIKLRVNGTILKPVFRGNEMLVPVRQGDVVHIIVEHKAPQTVLMRLLVDGLNTLPQKITFKGVRTLEVAPRVNLDEARPWVLDPTQTRKFFIKGFVTETGVNGKLREFEVVESQYSIAAQKQFTDQIGMITAAFYAPAAQTRGPLGIGAGEERNEDLKERDDVDVGNLLHVVHIRYVNADDLNNAVSGN